MDNNQNNTFNGQPVNNQSVQPQQQANPFGQQPQQGGSPFGQQFSPKKPVNVSLGLISLICGAVSLFMAVLGSIFACTCSASKSYDAVKMTERLLKGKNMYSTSAVIVVSIIAALIAIAAVVLAVMALKKDATDKMAKIALALGAFSVLYAVLPMLTVCGYNCSLNNAYEYAVGNAFSSLF